MANIDKETLLRLVKHTDASNTVSGLRDGRVMIKHASNFVGGARRGDVAETETAGRSGRAETCRGSEWMEAA